MRNLRPFHAWLACLGLIPAIGMLALGAELVLLGRGPLFGIATAFATVLACFVVPVSTAVVLARPRRSVLVSAGYSAAAIGVLGAPLVILVDPAEASRVLVIFATASLIELGLCTVALAAVRARLRTPPTSTEAAEDRPHDSLER